jgi:CRISPR-associated protein Cas1
VTVIRPPAAELPETVPARMVNEFVYCPRLFHLEWVQGRFAANDDVEEGLYVHRVVDEPGGDLPGPENDVERFAGRTSRSLWLSSPDLGVSAKLDIAEVGVDGSVVPVDFKKGSPDPHGRPWSSDEVQSLIQAILLREAGYRVPTAEIWYAEPRRRITIEVTDARVAETTETLRRLWQVAAQDQAPPPLVDSPKCPRCSLVGVCLPDEINSLRIRERSGGPRRVMAPAPDGRPVHVMEQGALVAARRGRLEVFRERETLASYRLIDISQVNLHGNISVSPQAMRELFAREIPVSWFSYGGWFTGMAHGLPGKDVEFRRAQYCAPPAETLHIARRMVHGKIRNARTLLRRNHRGEGADRVVAQLSDLVEAAAAAEGVPTLLGIEGTAARLYFSRFTGMLTNPEIDTASFDQNGRSRRPPPDPVNALLSFVYALLVKDLTVVINAVGLDPYLGVYHRPRYGRPALALDLAEEFRPIVADSTVVQVINNSEIRARHFTQRAGGCQLDRDGRRVVLAAYERRMTHEIKHPVFGYRVSYRRALDVQARLLAAHLKGEIPEYTPFTTR